MSTDAPNAAANQDGSAAMTREAAQARKAEYLSTPALRDKLLAGDVATKKDWSSVNATLASTMPDPGVVAREVTSATWWAKGVPEDALKQFVAGGAVLPSERQAALDLKASVMKDGSFRRAYLDGSREAATMAKISLVLASPVKEPEQK
jgi:hypothetical protein